MTARQHYDHDAEAAVLGGIFRDNASMARVADLEVDDFHSPKHQAVWMAMRNLEHDGVDAIEPVTVAAELKRLGRAAALGGRLGEDGCLLAMHELAMHTTIPANVERYGQLLKTHRTSRDLLLAASEVVDRLRSGAAEDFEGDEAVRWAFERLASIKSRVKDRGRFLGDLMIEELDELDRDLVAIAAGERVVTGMPTGVTGLDDGVGGYPIGVVSMVMGAPGHGKSTVLGAAARATVLSDDFAFVYSFEDPSKFWAQRSVGQESGIPTEAIARRRDLDRALQMRSPGEFAFRRLQVARANAWKRREVIVPAAGMDVGDVIADVRGRRMSMQAQVGGRRRRLLVLIDYVQVMRFKFQKGVSSRTEAIGDTMDRLQWLAQGCGSDGNECSVVIASQVNSSVEKERRAPNIHDWAESYSTVRVSKLVLGINRPGKYDRSVNQRLGSLDVLKRNQGEDHCHADVVLDLAIHTIRDVNDVREDEPAQAPLAGLGGA